MPMPGVGIIGHSSCVVNHSLWSGLAAAILHLVYAEASPLETVGLPGSCCPYKSELPVGPVGYAVVTAGGELLIRAQGRETCAACCSAHRTAVTIAQASRPQAGQVDCPPRPCVALTNREAPRGLHNAVRPLADVETACWPSPTRPACVRPRSS